MQYNFPRTFFLLQICFLTVSFQKVVHSTKERRYSKTNVKLTLFLTNHFFQVYHNRDKKEKHIVIAAFSVFVSYSGMSLFGDVYFKNIEKNFTSMTDKVQ